MKQRRGFHRLFDKYSDYLRSKLWKNRRRGIVRARKCCERCGSKKKLNVHHTSYQRVEREKDKELIVLCQKCHELLHKLLDEKFPNLSLREKVVHSREIFDLRKWKAKKKNRKKKKNKDSKNKQKGKWKLRPRVTDTPKPKQANFVCEICNAGRYINLMISGTICPFCGHDNAEKPLQQTTETR